MTCTKCGNEVYALVDGVCMDCKRDAEEKEAKIRKRGCQKGAKLSKRQLPETLELNKYCRSIMKTLEIAPYQFAYAYGLTQSSFYRWLNGEFSEKRQPKYNAMLRDAVGDDKSNV